MNHLLKLGFLLLLTTFLFGCDCKKNNKHNRPNIILILVDDLGYGDLGYTGCTDFETPNIDKLAKGGIICTNGYASHSFCAPTRAGIMTGRYQHRFEFESNPGSKNSPDLGISEEEFLLPQLLSKAGYRSALVGKWHLGVDSVYHPLIRGFDEFFGFVGGGHDYYTSDKKQTNKHSYQYPIEKNGKQIELRNYLTEEFTDYAVDFITSEQNSPFFLFLSYNAPHAPLQAPEKYIQRVFHIKDEERRIYAAMITALDDGVGKIMHALTENGIENNTLIFFMSDNGGVPRSYPSNKPFQGSKGTVLEGGIHVPYIVYWKGSLQPQTYDKPLMSFDFFSTATATAYVENPRDRIIDSKNLIPYLTGQQKEKPHDFLFWKQSDYQMAVRDERFKLIKIKNRKSYLFNLGNDKSETQDLSEVNEKMTNELNSLMQSWLKEIPESGIYKSSGIAFPQQQQHIDELENTRLYKE